MPDPVHISTGYGSSHLPVGAIGNDLGKIPHQGLAAHLERRSAPYVEPLMGWIADDDPLATISSGFRHWAAVPTPSGTDFPMSCRPLRSRARVSSLPRAEK